MYQKPLYQAEKQIQYQRHLQRLQKITKKKLSNQHATSANTIQVMHRAHNLSSDFNTKERRHLLDYENNKILSKIIEISERKNIPKNSTITHHVVPKKQCSIIMFDNPQRRRRNQQILNDNGRIARRLLTKDSEFDREKVVKEISQYERIKKTMKNNRRIKLVPVRRARDNGFDFTRVSTVQNSRTQFIINPERQSQTLNSKIKPEEDKREYNRGPNGYSFD